MKTHQRWLDSPSVEELLEAHNPTNTVHARKYGLLIVAVVRAVWDLLPSDGHRHFVNHYESYLEGEMSRYEVLKLRPEQAHYPAFHNRLAAGILYQSGLLDARPNQVSHAFHLAERSLKNIHDLRAMAPVSRRSAETIVLERRMVSFSRYACEALRDILSSPFKRVRLGRECAACNGVGLLKHRPGDGTVVIDMYCTVCKGEGRTGHRDHITPDVMNMARTAYQRKKTLSIGCCNENLGILADALEEAGCPCEGLLQHLREPVVHHRGCWALDEILGKEVST